MAYTARLAKQQLRQRRDATRDRSRDNTKGTIQYLVTYAYTNNDCLLCASNIIVSVAIPTRLSPLFALFQYIPPLFRENYYFLPYFDKFPPIFDKFTCFIHTLRVFPFPPTLTMMHFICITQCT